MLILKFGGTSVGDAAAMRRVVAIVREARARERRLVVVASAMSRVTDALVKAARAAEAGDDAGSEAIVAALLARHLETIDQLRAGAGERELLRDTVQERLHDVQRICHSVAVLRELTPRTLDLIASTGERLSAPILAAALSEAGTPARPVDAAQVVVTDDRFGSANPVLDETRANAARTIVPLLDEGLVVVVNGFVGATAHGVTTTLGRGGSDYTAAILGACLKAEEVQIWTDVDGIMTADPRVVPQARTLPELSYAEAAELSYFGAKVLHPKTILPAMERDIPVRILNTFNPSCPGTLVICHTAPRDDAVKAVSTIKGLSLITVEGRGMMGVPGIAGRTFSAVARTNSSVLMISQASSEQSICFIIPRPASDVVQQAIHAEFERELAWHNVDRIWSQDDVAIVAVVGAGMRGTPGIAARIFGALGAAQINVVAVAQGSSECNVSLVVEERDADPAMQHIHREFNLEGSHV